MTKHCFKRCCRTTPAYLFLLSVLVVRSVLAQTDSAYQTYGVRNNLPVFSPKLTERLNFPLSWLSGHYYDFAVWKHEAHEKAMECLLAPPSGAPFHPVVLAQQDRGSYVAQKIVFNLTGDSRVLGYLLIPKGHGPFPAVLLLHDHGGRFDIGKEKVIEPFNDTTNRPRSAREWVEKLYGGRFIGDELAKRGYVCFATDALNWSDRGGAGGEGQQAIASNLFNLGMSFAGLIAWEDMRAASFLASQPMVDSTRVIAMGLSLGSYRAWQVAALSDHITGAVSVCWLSTMKSQMTAGSNQTKGNSAFTMTHPNLSNYLDYADVASIACPKPMLFYNGTQDHLFPVDGVTSAYEKLHAVWKSQHAEQNLETRFWNAGHIFNLDMQTAAFAWLDAHFKTNH